MSSRTKTVTRKDLQNFIIQVFDELERNYLKADLWRLANDIHDNVIRSNDWPMTMSLEVKVHSGKSFEDLQIVRFVHEEEEVESVIAVMVHFPLPDPAYVVFSIGPGSFQFALRLVPCPQT